MSNFQRELTEYIGIDEICTTNKTNFNQFNLEDIILVPTQKPDIEQINKVWINSCITDFEVIKTPIGKSLEGQILTGSKLFICGEIMLKVEYVADVRCQTVHTMHTMSPFCTYVVMPERFNSNAIIKPSVLIEDVFTQKINERCIYNNVTLAVIVDIS